MKRVTNFIKCYVKTIFKDESLNEHSKDDFCLVLFEKSNDNELYRIRCTEDCYLTFQSMWYHVEKLK